MFFIHHTVPTSMVITCLAYTETCSLISSNITFLAMKSLQVQGLCRFQSYPNGYVTSLRFGFGMTVMMLGFSIVCYHDSILCSLKSRAVTTPCNNGVSKDGDNHLVSSSSPASNGKGHYKIPYGGLFYYVSAPHFLGEIIEWIGYAIAAQSYAAWSFPMWTAANLIPRAISQHIWYRSHFDTEHLILSWT